MITLAFLCVLVERTGVSSLVAPFIRSLILSNQGPTLIISSNLNYLEPLPNIATLVLGLQHVNLGVCDQSTQSLTGTKAKKIAIATILLQIPLFPA